MRAVISDAVTEPSRTRIGFVTVTDVRASADLQQATVYVSSSRAGAKRAATLAGLAESSRGFSRPA